MPVRRFNYTNRQRIVRDDVEITLRVQDSQTTFDARLDLSEYAFPPDARVFVEAYRQTNLVRFDFGTASVLQSPADRFLTDFDSPVEVLFRVRVTAASGRVGVLLGEADQIKPREPDERPDRRVALLPVVPDDLDEELWRVDFGSNVTYLLVNKQLADWKETARSPEFRALVYPAAMRQILDRILRVDNVTTTEDANDVRSLWLRFATLLPGSRSVPRASEDYDEWVEDAVAAFARKARFRSMYETAEQG
jgi:hypothetical protein